MSPDVVDGHADGIKIGELVRRAGVTRATIHHYVKEGLLPEPRKTSRNMALYSPECVERVRLIRGLQQNQRRTLAEVRTLLTNAHGRAGLARLRALLDAEASRQPLLLADRPRTDLNLTQLCERSGFGRKEIRAFEELGLLTSVLRRGRRVYDAADVEVIDALAGLHEAGFDAAHGFGPQDVLLYLDALRSLLHKELDLFLERAQLTEDRQRFLALAEQGVERTTPLLLALRRKLIRELLEMAESEG